MLVWQTSSCQTPTRLVDKKFHFSPCSRWRATAKKEEGVMFLDQVLKTRNKNNIQDFSVELNSLLDSVCAHRKVRSKSRWRFKGENRKTAAFLMKKWILLPGNSSNSAPSLIVPQTNADAFPVRDAAVITAHAGVTYRRTERTHFKTPHISFYRDCRGVVRLEVGVGEPLSSRWTWVGQTKRLITDRRRTRQ